jgi:hypothetical protein
VLTEPNKLLKLNELEDIYKILFYHALNQLDRWKRQFGFASKQGIFHSKTTFFADRTQLLSLACRRLMRLVCVALFAAAHFGPRGSYKNGNKARKYNIVSLKFWSILPSEWVNPGVTATPYGYRKRDVSTLGSGTIPFESIQAP